MCIRDRAQAVQLKADMTKAAKERLAEAEEQAKTQAEEMMQAAAGEGERERAALRDAVAAKQQQAVDLIMSELL